MPSAPPDFARAVAIAAEYSPVALLEPSRGYAHTGSHLFPVQVVPISRIECFARGPGVEGLNRERALAVLEALIRRIPLPPVNVYPCESPGADGKRFVLYHGYHRLHLSLAVGYTHIPVAVNHIGAASAA